MTIIITDAIFIDLGVKDNEVFGLLFVFQEEDMFRVADGALFTAGRVVVLESPESIDDFVHFLFVFCIKHHLHFLLLLQLHLILFLFKQLHKLIILLMIILLLLNLLLLL